MWVIHKTISLSGVHWINYLFSFPSVLSSKVYLKSFIKTPQRNSRERERETKNEKRITSNTICVFLIFFNSKRGSLKAGKKTTTRANKEIEWEILKVRGAWEIQSYENSKKTSQAIVKRKENQIKLESPIKSEGYLVFANISISIERRRTTKKSK